MSGKEVSEYLQQAALHPHQGLARDIDLSMTTPALPHVDCVIRLSAVFLTLQVSQKAKGGRVILLYVKKMPECMAVALERKVAFIFVDSLPPLLKLRYSFVIPVV
jgi:hypothetical protein